MACLITHEQQEQVQVMLTKLLEASSYAVEFSLELSRYKINEEQELNFRIWISYLNKNFVFKSLKEMFNSFELLIEQIKSKKNYDIYLEKYVK